MRQCGELSQPVEPPADALKGVPRLPMMYEATGAVPERARLGGRKIPGLGRSKLKEALALFCACRHRQPPSVSYVMHILRTQQRTRQPPPWSLKCFSWV